MGTSSDDHSTIQMLVGGTVVFHLIRRRKCFRSFERHYLSHPFFVLLCLSFRWASGSRRGSRGADEGLGEPTRVSGSRRGSRGADEALGEPTMVSGSRRGSRGAGEALGEATRFSGSRRGSRGACRPSCPSKTGGQAAQQGPHRNMLSYMFRNIASRHLSKCLGTLGCTSRTAA